MLLVLFRDGLLLFSVLVRLLKIFFFLWLCAPSGDVVAPGVFVSLVKRCWSICRGCVQTGFSSFLCIIL